MHVRLKIGSTNESMVLYDDICQPGWDLFTPINAYMALAQWSKMDKLLVSNYWQRLSTQWFIVLERDALLNMHHPLLQKVYTV